MREHLIRFLGFPPLKHCYCFICNYETGLETHFSVSKTTWCLCQVKFNCKIQLTGCFVAQWPMENIFVLETIWGATVV